MYTKCINLWPKALFPMSVVHVVHVSVHAWHVLAPHDISGIFLAYVSAKLSSNMCRPNGPGLILGMSTIGTLACCCHLPHFQELHAYVLAVCKNWLCKIWIVEIRVTIVPGKSRTKLSRTFTWRSTKCFQLFLHWVTYLAT